MSERGEMACAVCGTKLNHLELSNGRQGWVHNSLIENADHYPLPVHESTIRTTYSCDFCNQTPADFVVPAKPFSALSELDQMVVNYSDGDWSACWTCAALVSSNQWQALLRRTSQRFQERHGVAMTKDSRVEAWAYFQHLRRNITGPIRER